MSGIEKFFDEARKTLEALIGSGITALPPDNDYLFENFDSTLLKSNREKNTNIIGVFKDFKYKSESVSEYACGDKIIQQNLILVILHIMLVSSHFLIVKFILRIYRYMK